MECTKVILLQRVANFGEFGSVVNVKPGFARNYLLPRKIALRATKKNIEYFESKKAQIEKANAETKGKAEEIKEKMANLSVSIIRQASDKDQLYGSVTCRDIASAIKELGFSIAAGQVCLSAPIKLLGSYDISVNLHPEVAVAVKLIVTKSAEELYQPDNREAQEASL